MPSPGRDLWIRFFKVVVPPVLLVLAVLGSIIAGVAAPTEAASMGALGSILVTAFAGRLSFAVLRDVVQSVTKITAMMMFILICARRCSRSPSGACTARTSSPRCSSGCRAAWRQTSGS